MNPVVKGALQGAIPTLVLVGGTNLIVKKFRDSKPVLYWGSLAVATGVAVAVVQGRIPAPFMKAETFDAEEVGCDWVQIEHGNHPTKMSYIWYCEKLNAQIDSIKKPSRNRKVRPNSFTQNWRGGNQSHYFGAETFESPAHIYQYNGVHYQIKRNSYKPTGNDLMADIDFTNDKGEWIETIETDYHANIDEVHKDAQRIIDERYGAETFEANAGGLKCNVCQNMVADTDGDKYFVCDTCANNEGMGAESFEADADTSSATPQYFYRWIGSEYSGNPIYFGTHHKNSLVHYVHPVYDEDYVKRLVDKLNAFL